MPTEEINEAETGFTVISADPNCQHCGGSGWIGDIACPACSS